MAPYGIGGVKLANGALERALARDFVLVVGDRDTADGPRPAPVIAQGRNRVSRALRLFAAAFEAAGARGVPLAWRLRIAYGLDHSPLGVVTVDFEEIVR